RRPAPTPSPYTTLFRSVPETELGRQRGHLVEGRGAARRPLDETRHRLAGEADLSIVGDDPGERGPLPAERRAERHELPRGLDDRSEEHTSELQSRENLV